jgi:hypothetical protein
MKNKLTLLIIKAIVPTLIDLLTPEVIKDACDAALDVVENAAQKSKNKVDDATILPACKMIRDALDIPDND